MANAQAIDQVLKRAAEANDVPGVVALAATDRSVIYEGAFGKRELGKEAGMTLDTVVWIASMTKAMTAAGAMQLVEHGRLKLDSAAAEVVPDLAKATVLEGFDAAGKPKLRAPRRPITLRQLLTHTAGFSYEIWSADIAKYQAATGTPGITTCENAALTTPLLFDPGTRWDYGINMDWVGKMVEAASGQKLGDYLQQNLFAPLGMTSTSFKLTPSQRSRLASVHARGPDGALAVFPFELPQEPQFQIGGGGLYCTAQDYIRFTQMILNRGKSNGNQVLMPETVQMMSQNQMGDIDVGVLKTAAPPLSNDVALFPGMKLKWGLSFLINTAQTPQGRSAGSLAWAGLANTFFWIDPVKRVTGVFLTQVLPFFDQKTIGLLGDFETAVYQSL
ncbi:MAG: beta-lactamase family protein [Betaproteobacteria bacterium]|nr:beta-lactamase family protein [Betaproteobacteria bacterium]